MIEKRNYLVKNKKIKILKAFQDDEFLTDDSMRDENNFEFENPSLQQN